MGRRAARFVLSGGAERIQPGQRRAALVGNSDMVGPQPVVATAPLPGSSVTSLVWMRDGELFVTAIAKVTLELVAGSVARQIDPDPVEIAEFADSSGCLWTAGDRAPMLLRADVLVVGNAPKLDPTATRPEARLVFRRDSHVLIDKRVPLGGALGAGRPSMGALGPIPSRAPLRARMLGSLQAPDPSVEPMNVPRGLDLGFFQAAARDQQVDSIRAGDCLLLEGLIEGMPRFDARLPPLDAEAKLYGADQQSGVPTAFPLRGDTLLVDVGRRVCSIVFRGHVSVSVDPAELSLVAGVQVGSRRMPFAPPPRPRGVPVDDLTATLVRTSGDVGPQRVAPAARDSATIMLPGPATMPVPAPPAARARKPPPPPRHRAAAAAAYAKDAPTAPTPAAARPVGPAHDRPAEAPLDLHATASLDGEQLRVLQAQHALPFDAKPHRSSTPPPPAEPPSSSMPADFGQTASLDGRELAVLRAQYAVPFDPKPRRSSAPPPAAAAPPPTDRNPTAVRAEPGLDQTAALTGAEIERLRAQYAVPFDATPRRASTPAAASPALAPAATTSETGGDQGGDGAVAFTALGLEPRLGDTAAAEDDELVKLRVQYAVPFDAKPLRSPSSPPTLPDACQPVGELGQAFLTALGELDESNAG
jgi:hypothetical protein